MTLEELKIEAKRQGYKLIKDNPLPKIGRCECGRRPRQWWTSEQRSFYKCDHCGKQSDAKVKRRDIIEAWNTIANKNGKEETETK